MKIAAVNHGTLKRLVLPILRVIQVWLPPRVGGIVYSFTLLLVGLLWVYMRSFLELYKFFTGQIPPSQHVYVKTDGVLRSQLLQPERMELRIPVVEELRLTLQRHGGDLYKLITGYPRKSDLRKDIACLKRMGDAYGDGCENPDWPEPFSLPIHGEAFRIAFRFFPEPLANVAFRRALAEFRSRDPMDPQELSREVKSLCDAMWEEVNTEPDCSASKTVMEKLLKLSRLSHRRLKLDG